MPTLLDIPDLVMRRILKDADFKQIFRLRKVCSPLRTFLDLTLQPDIQLEWIQLSAITNGMSCYMGTNVDDYKNKKYDKQRTASFVLVDTDMEQWQDLAMILRYQKSSLKFLKLMCSLEENMDGYDKFLEFFMTILSNNETQLRVSNLKMHAMNQTQVLRVLPYLDPKTLVSISIENSMVFDTRGGDMEIDEIVQTEQYQKAKGLYILGCDTNASIFQMSHFNDLTVSLKSFSTSGVLHAKEKLIDLSINFRYEIRYHEFEDIDGLTVSLGQPTESNDRQDIWIINLPNADQQILAINHCVESNYFVLNRRIKGPPNRLARFPLFYE
ncbi:hypothetical protein CRE_18746 [Caenorhabditis remanei]|uniref:F-box domain-containing protein n=1 Tax=Caenorhabditis remanei TaxID=31234 RepID=E3LJR7_CAERE|nr:hypothetical protein CRE_18746 [Caenorhabditis remanei]